MSQRDYERYEVQEALHTIHRAEEHKRDKGLMRHVKKLAASQAQAAGASPAKPSAAPKRSQPQKKPPQKRLAPEAAPKVSKGNPMLKGRE